MGGKKTAKEETESLYARLGGDSFISMLTCAFFDEIVENPDLKRFFKNISTSALKAHQVKLFRVIFGKEEDKPEGEDLLDFMLRTHTRLFRELGLNEDHFDQVANCFVQGLQTFQVEQSLIDECVAILVPLRVVFEYGAQVAVKEKEMTQEEIETLPKASPKTLGTEVAVVLPEYSKIEIPDWLPETLGKHSNTSTVRAWTCNLTDRFGGEGDLEIADTFMDQPYMDHHVYLVALLELAFLPDDVEPSHRGKVLEIVLYPRGPRNAPLSKELFDRMISQFLLTCHIFGMSAYDVRAVENRLKGFRNIFADKTTIVGGLNAPHILLKMMNKKKAQSTKSSKSRDPFSGSEGSGALSLTGSSTSLASSLSMLDFSDDDSTCSATSRVTLNSSCSGKSVSSRSKKKKSRRKSKGLSIFRAMLLGSKKKSSTKEGPKHGKPQIPSSIEA